MVLIKVQSIAEKFETYIRILRFSASICGIDLFHEDYRMNWITYTLFTSTAGYFIFVFLTIYKNYQDDWSILLRASVTLGSACQGVSKLYTFISGKKAIQDLLKIYFSIYRDYEKLGDKYKKALETGLQRTRSGLVFLTFTYVIGFLGMATLPYIWLLITGKRSLVMEFEVPYLDIRTDFGYFTTLVFQSVLIICFAFGLYCGDLGALIYLLQSHIFANIFSAKIEYLNEMIQDPEDNMKPSVSMALKDIIKWLQLYSHCTAKLNKLLYYIVTVEIVSAFFSTVLCIYLIMSGSWPGAYTYILVAFGCLYLYCILGTEIELANIKFEREIYALHWYNLNVQQQKMVLQVLVMTQKPQIIDIAGVAPLSVRTALTITKAVYSITMVMIQFLLE